jgi:hypothetical protein
MLYVKILPAKMLGLMQIRMISSRTGYVAELFNPTYCYENMIRSTYVEFEEILRCTNTFVLSVVA